MKKKIWQLIIGLVFFTNIQYSQKQNIEFKRHIIDQMTSAIKAQNQLTFIMQKKERDIKSSETERYITGKLYAKLNVDPFKMYIKSYYPSPGAEILYKDGWNDNEALVNPNAFPYFSFSFRPEHYLLLAGGHHCLKEAGFKLLCKMIEHYKKVFENKVYELIEYNGVYLWNKRRCYKLTIRFPDYKVLNYECKRGDNLYKIAERLLINVGKLRELNPRIKDTEYLKENQQIKATNFYAEKIILYIDIEKKFPILQEIYDKKGLYEKFMYLTLDINNPISNEEFNRNYKDYNF